MTRYRTDHNYNQKLSLDDQDKNEQPEINPGQQRGDSANISGD